MAPPVKSAAHPIQSHGVGADPSRENPPSNTLWIGNVSPAVSESELKALFGRYGEVDSFTTYPSRNYAFVSFKEIDDAKSAKLTLQGHVLRGNPLKIEFTKPAKPCKSLWVAGISQSVSKEEFEREFLRFGNIQELRFLRDRNTAYVDYVRLEDATQALNAMNKKELGGTQIRVDYLRSHSSRREQGPEPKEVQFPSRNMGPSDLRWMGQDSLNNYPELGLSGSKRKSHFMPVGSDSLPSRVLWISYPPSVFIEEDMLHNAMILFGEIERIKTISDRNCAFVEFRSVEEARCAKEGLQGKLFNDPRIKIEYYNNEFPGVGGQAGDPLQPVPVDILGLHRALLVGGNTGHAPSIGMHGSDMYSRMPLGPHGLFEPALHGLDAIELAAVRKLQNPTPQNLIGGPTWRRSSPTPRVVSSPSEGLNVPNRSASGPWDVFDANQLKRESKRPRLDSTFPPENLGGLDEHYGKHSLNSNSASGSLTRATTGGIRQRHTENDCIWRGLIAKGGTPVCRARCVPIGEGLDAEIPTVVNISARTGLDLLSQRYEDAIGFDIVFFLPDSEDDFASYTEFLRYLGSRGRAGVAKFDDGTTLFLVPPSEFLTDVLKVSGPERLYGVVLKFPQVAPSIATMGVHPIHHQHVDLPKTNTLPAGYSVIPQEEQLFPPDNSRFLPDDAKLSSKALPVTASVPADSVPPATMVASQAGFGLTPELIATLTSLLPANNGSSASQTGLLQQTSTMLDMPDVASDPDGNVAHWRKHDQTVDRSGQLLPQMGSQINSQLQQLQAAQATPVVSNITSHFHQPANSYGLTLPSQIPNSSRSIAPLPPLQSRPASVGPELNQHYQRGSSQDVLRGNGVDTGTDAPSFFYNSSFVQQPSYPVPLPNQVPVNNVSLPQPYTAQPSDVELSHQSHSLQIGPFGAAQENTETEADKNERYKTTLLFAANLLSRIHQPSGHQPEQGAGSH